MRRQQFTQAMCIIMVGFGIFILLAASDNPAGYFLTMAGSLLYIFGKADNDRK